MMKHLKKVLPVYLLTVVFIALQVITEPAGAASRSANLNTKVITNRLLTGLAVVSTNDIWAVGYSFTSNGVPQTLTEHWNGTKWSIVASPNVGTGDNYLYGVAVVSTNNIWAVGDYFSMGFYHGLIEHWNGSSWSLVTAPIMGSGNHLQGVATVSQNNVWAVGYYFNGSVFQTLIEHWNGSSWSVASSPNVGTNNNYLQSLSVASGSASDIWTVGFSFDINNNAQTLIEHWNGSSWSVISSPNAGTNGSNLWAVAGVSAKDVWAVGAYANSNSVYQTLTEHWNGSTWSVVNSPNVGTNDSIFYGVAEVSTGNVWAVGAYIDSSGFDRTLIENWNGTKWNVVKSSDMGKGNNNLAGVAVVSVSNVWSVGDYLNSANHYFSLIEQWNGTKWSIVKSPK